MRLTFALIGVFAFLQVYSVQAILPILQQDFLANETQLGLTVGATVVGIAMISPFWGCYLTVLDERISLFFR